jgi:hypothetical protein
MNKQIQQTTKEKSGATKTEHRLNWLITLLFQSDLMWLGHNLLKILRLKWHGRSIKAEQGQKEGISLPSGPFVTTRKNQLGDLLLWAPRRMESYLIDDLTGGYGYSHSTIDTGEIDMPTQKPVMLEITVGQTVMRKFQDEYEQRSFVRVPISETGVDTNQFVECVLSKMGEQYDDLDAITLGEITEPAREVCSGLATDCLPEKERQRIALAKRMGLLRMTSVSVHSRPGALKTRVFISPNGFAEYYGAPVGSKLTGPNTNVIPQPVEISAKKITAAAARHHGLKVIAGVAAIVLMVFVLKRLRINSLQNQP